MRIKAFMTNLNYASCNEDWRSEWDALKITSDDRILCITGSGDRPLNLLFQGPGKVIAMDLNPVQNHLLRLKIAAMKELPYDEYSSFLGLSNGGDRLKNWRRIRHNLPEEAREFWDRYAHILEKGVIYQGRWENYLRKLALIAKVMRGPTIRKLFEFDDVEKQRRFIDKRWDRLWWRLMFNMLVSTTFSRTFFGDPGFYQYVSKDMNVGKYIFEGMKQYLENYLARESFMLSLMFRGRLDEYDLPPYLDRDCLQKIIKRMDKVEIRTENILEFMETVEENSFTKFSLSDVPSFLDQEMFERLLDGIVRSGAHGARFCIRQFLTDQVIPDRFEAILVREPNLEDRLSKRDRSFAYRFVVGRVKKGG
jgi:S-adenosylmethionine-diacylglycerol 3-amino-3-carboxypropyl transferase